MISSAISQEIILLLINNVHEKNLGNVFTTYLFAVLHPLLATSCSGLKT